MWWLQKGSYTCDRFASEQTLAVLPHHRTFCRTCGYMTKRYAASGPCSTTLTFTTYRDIPLLVSLKDKGCRHRAWTPWKAESVGVKPNAFWNSLSGWTDGGYSHASVLTPKRKSTRHQMNIRLEREFFVKEHNTKTKLRGLSPRDNCTDRVNAACWRS
jgi:hypothetical protein